MTEEEVGLRLALKNRREVQRGVHDVGDELDRTGDKAHRVGREARYGAAGLLTLGKSGRVAGRAVLYGTGAMAAGVVGLGVVTAKFTKDAVKGWEDHTKVVRQSRAVIKSTGGAANLTARQVGNLSDSLERKTGVDGDVIQSGANMLLTFKNVRNEQGAGNKIFSRSLSILNDMSVAMKSDASKSAIQLGKALNDPIKGVTALAKVGVTFTDGQKEQIENYVEQGKMASAQKIILRELSSEFAGSAKAQMTSGDQVMVGYHQLQDTIGKAVIPLQEKFNRFLINDGIPTAQRYAELFEKRGVPAIAKYASIFEDRGIPAIKDFLDEAKPVAFSVLPAIGDGLETTADAVKVIAPRLKSIFDGYNNLPDWAKQAIIIGAGGAAVGKKLGAGSLLGKGGLLGSVASIAKPLPVYVVNSLPGTPAVPGGGGKPGFPAVPPILGKGLPFLARAASLIALPLNNTDDKVHPNYHNIDYGNVGSEADFKRAISQQDTLNKKTILFSDTLRGIDRTWRPSIFVDGLDPALDKANDLRTTLLGVSAFGSYGNGLGVLASSRPMPKRNKPRTGLTTPRAAYPPVEQQKLDDDFFGAGAGRAAGPTHVHVHVGQREIADVVLDALLEIDARRR